MNALKKSKTWEYGLAAVCVTTIGSKPGNGNEYITTGSDPVAVIWLLKVYLQNNILFGTSRWIQNITLEMTLTYKKTERLNEVQKII